MIHFAIVFFFPINISPLISSMAKDSLKFLTKYLATFSGEDVAALSEAKEEAVRAVVEFVKVPDMFQVMYLII